MDVNPGELVVLGTTAPLAMKVLGPTADYVGGGIQTWTSRRLQNVQRIFEIAGRRLGDEGLKRPGEVPPRMLKEVFDEGSYHSDELGAEYFGGLLASSRSIDQNDDRAAALAALVGRLSSYQLRSHYVFYAHAQRLMAGSDLNLGLTAAMEREGRIYMPFAAWLVGMDLEDPDSSAWRPIFDHCIHGLLREGLLDPWWSCGGTSHLEGAAGRQIPESGVIYTPSMLGVELFSSAHGVDESPIAAFLSIECPLTTETSIELVDSPALVHQLPKPGMEPVD